MQSKFRPSPAMVVALVALFVSLGGTAAALSGSNTVFSDDIDNDTSNSPTQGQGGLVAADLRPSSVGTSEVAANSLGAGDLAPNSVGTSEVADGSIGSSDLAPAVVGARAYGRVDSVNQLSRSKNVISVTHPATGVFCINLADGIDEASAVLVVGPDINGSATDASFDRVTVVQWNSAGSGCPAGRLEVRTFIYFGDSTDNNVGGDNLEAEDEAFAFVVP
jgi:hypothetical protein